MIRSFADRETENLFHRRSRRQFASFARAAFAKLVMIDNARRIEDLMQPPGNRLEKLKGTGRARGASVSMTGGESASNGRMAMRTELKSLTTTDEELKDGAPMPPLHPGELLREDFMKPLGLSANALAMELRVPVTRISEIVRERRGISGDTALRLGRYFNMSPEFWMGIQTRFELDVAADAAGEVIEREIRPRPLAALPQEEDSRAIA
jgi:addiction module HigA family antidote